MELYGLIFSVIVIALLVLWEITDIPIENISDEPIVLIIVISILVIFRFLLFYKPIHKTSRINDKSQGADDTNSNPLPCC